MASIQEIKNVILGKSKNPQDSKIFHKLSLVAFIAWVGLGSDGLSSSCYGPQEAYLTLGSHIFLSVFVALGTVLTILIISASYSQIVEIFPTGGGGYLVASKLLSPTVGMISGSALLIDYVLTITVSVASGADAIFSLLPLYLHSYKLGFAMLIILILIWLNLRGIKESVLSLTPIFVTFIATHLFIIIYALCVHLPQVKDVAASTAIDIRSTVSGVGFLGMIFLLFRAYSMGAGTYTGLEAVSNGIPVLREPRVETAKKTMLYMAVSLSFVVMGLMLAYIFYKITPEQGKTLNAILFEKATGAWSWGYIFVLVALASEGALLFVAAQTGFIDAPRVLANMALDRWLPTRFSVLSSRLVIQNGVLITGGLALVIMALARGSVRFLVVLYSINVFITFVLSQLGMVRHWWLSRDKVKNWLKKFIINGIGLCLSALILLTMIVFKFYEGGWITLLITGALVAFAFIIKRHYYRTAQLLHRLNNLVTVSESSDTEVPHPAPAFNPAAKTAVLFVNGFNGMGLHTLFGVIRLFGSSFKNFVFVQIGVVDVGNFKGAEEVNNLTEHTKHDVRRYVDFMQKQGFYAEGFHLVGVDVIGEARKIIPDIMQRFPDAVIFGGQLVFPKESLITRWLHNYTVFAMQRIFYREGIPFVILPIRV